MEIHAAETSERKNDNENVDQRLTSIRQVAQKAASLSSAQIFRAPSELRKLNESAYTPRLIAIGPLHQNDPHLQTPMQNVKTSYMNNLLCRMTKEMENQDAEQKRILQECVEAMEKLIEDAKKCYAEEVTLDVDMMLVDGCFILEFLLRNFLRDMTMAEIVRTTMCQCSNWRWFGQTLTEEARARFRASTLDQDPDPIFDCDSTFFAIQHDLLLLENQIPFFVLKKLFRLTVARIPSIGLGKRHIARDEFKLSLTEGVYARLPMVDQLLRPVEVSTNPFDILSLFLDKRTNNSEQEDSSDSEDSEDSEDSSGNPKRYHHILHKLHADYHPRGQPDTAPDDLTEQLPSASELVYAGVKFIRSTGDNLFQVEFTEHKDPSWWYRRACFEIPFLLIEDSTESVLRNLIAFEQCCLRISKRRHISKHFTAYALLMDMLVNSDIDVQVLEEAGVLRNCLGAAEDVTELFNKLSREVSYGEFFFAGKCKKAIMYRKHFWPKNMAHVRRTYFASPWTVIAFGLGFIAFAITTTTFIRDFLK